MAGQGLLRFYYALTPLFMALDFGLKFNVRTAALDDSGWRWAWYAACLACWAIRQPRWRALAGLLESALNFLLLTLAVMIPVVTAPEAVFQGHSPQIITPQELINFMLSGSVAIALIHQKLANLRN